ncbi:hypothetical protein BV25DRAFT_1822360 [Artomyces pyxidatus]|uniref:Uncharacterized protein n=1 Tax=Artomyces pyxidatus TaxID=48021 RepID=A0ACB8TB30_9AGAM|nr:hypothetical protein BV25DRAFT_1822360 [Artomyces pyxidatus]
MWIVTGPFDGEVAGEIGQQKSKLLKSGKKYQVGRKDCDLLVYHKKVSATHAQIIVGGCTPEDVGDPDTRPSLEVFHTRPKSLQIHREGESAAIQVATSHVLQDGDNLDIVVGISLKFQWRPICCFESPGRVRTPVSIDGCASLGIKIVRSLHPSITHHLTPSFTLSPAIAVSLLTASQFVKPEWLQELLRLGMLEKHERGSLEATFALPPEAKYRPVFSASLPPALKTFKTWEANEERLNMFISCRFIFVGEKGREVGSEYQALVTRGRGEYEAFTVSAGLPRWRKALMKAKAWADGKKGQLVLVADNEAMAAAISPEGWEELVSEATSLNLQFVLPENLLQAVAHVDKFYFDSGSTGEGSNSSTLPSFVPNTHPDEPSIPPAAESTKEVIQPTRATRSGSSQPSEPLPPARITQSSTEVAAPPAEAPPARRAPRRATKRPLDLFSLDDSLLDDGPTASGSVTSEPAPNPKPSAKPPSSTVAARPSRPRRRTPGVTMAGLLGLDDDDLTEPSKESTQLDKYKALFEATDPDRQNPSRIQSTSDIGLGEGSAALPHSQTQTRSGTGTGGSGTIYRALAAVAEEEEESQMSHDGKRGKKRKAVVLGDDEDIEMQEMMADPDADLPEGTIAEPSTKRRAVEDVNAVRPTATQPPKPTGRATFTTSSAVIDKKGADAGKPDTDEKFLMAVNSTKRGKRKEDDFDREFNKLRLSKPDLAQTDPKEDWAVLADFGNDEVRGNFMVIVDLDIDTSAQPERKLRSEGKPEWVGKPDYKKFKKQNGAQRIAPVELVLSEENDYGVGAAYWKHSQTKDSAPPRFKARTQTKTGKPRKFGTSDSEEEEPAVTEPIVRKGKGKAAPAAESRAAVTRRRSQTPQQGKTALFLPDDDDDDASASRLVAPEEDYEMADDPRADEEDAMTSTLRTNGANTQDRGGRGARKPTAQKRKAPPVLDDDSDDAVFKGFRNKKRGRLG